MKKNFFINAAVIVLILSVSFLACKKNGTPERNARLQVYLTDDPGDYEKVFIDIKNVEYNITGDAVTGWQNLPGVYPGVYDLLTLVNDNDTLLADAEILSGRLEQIRLVLGPDNFVKLKGDPQLIRLDAPSAQQSGLKLNIHQDVVGGVLYKMTLDFDVAKSIVKTGNKKYMLKPVIRTMLGAVGGSIKGVVRPNNFLTTVYAINGVDSFGTYTASNGGYLIKGLAPGTYSVYFLPSNASYDDTTRVNIPVVLNTVKTVDTMFLHQ